jgi:hypothetical protein
MAWAMRVRDSHRVRCVAWPGGTRVEALAAWARSARALLPLFLGRAAHGLRLRRDLRTATPAVSSPSGRLRRREWLHAKE